MTRNLFLQLLAHSSSPLIGGVRVHDEGQGIHLLTVDQNIQLHQLGRLIALDVIIKRRIPPGTGLQRVKKVIDNLIEGKLIF